MGAAQRSLFSWGGTAAGGLVFIKEGAKETEKEGAGLGLHVLGLLRLRSSSLFEALKKDIVPSFVLSCPETWLVNRAILTQF